MEKIFFLDCENMTESGRAFDYLAEKLNADYSGRNPDALQDLLSGLGVCRIILINTAVLDRTGTFGKKLMDVFMDSTDDNPGLTLEFYRAGTEKFKELRQENASCEIHDQQVEEQSRRLQQEQEAKQETTQVTKQEEPTEGAGYRAELTGVLGDPVDDNPTGPVEEAAYRACHLNYRYLTIRCSREDLGDAIRGVRAFGMRGINLTMPHKIDVIPYLDECSRAAQIIGAVNTVINRNGRLIGENTDGKGFTTALKNHGLDLSGSRILILGAGGAARAIAVECALEGAQKITIVNRTEEKGQELAALIREKTSADSEFRLWKEVKVPEDTNLLINATSIGLKPQDNLKPDIDYDSIRPGMAVTDVVFNPVRTLFLQEAEKRGAAVYSGTGMLVQQAALNFNLWTGMQAPLEVMYDTLKECLGE